MSRLRATIPRPALLLCALSAIVVGCSGQDEAAGRGAVARYDSRTGRLERLEFDSTRNGRTDAVGIMHGTRVERIEVDEDEDGAVDRWEFYDASRRLVKVAFSRHDNGIVDATAFYGADGSLDRIEISTRGDGYFNRVERYRGESLATVEEDTNGDRLPDKWERYRLSADGAPESSRIASVAFDDRFRGTPTRRLFYRHDGTVLRVEVDPDGDGTFAESAVSAAQP